MTACCRRSAAVSVTRGQKLSRNLFGACHACLTLIKSGAASPVLPGRLCSCISLSCSGVRPDATRQSRLQPSNGKGKAGIGAAQARVHESALPAQPWCRSLPACSLEVPPRSVRRGVFPRRLFAARAGPAICHQRGRPILESCRLAVQWPDSAAANATDQIQNDGPTAQKARRWS